MTASDVRPPSGTGTTGWHTHSGRAAYRDDQCARHDDEWNPARPVIVADPTEAREAITRALDGHEGIRWVKKSGGWDCWCGHELTARWAPALSVDATGPWRAHIADMLAGVLAGQGQP